MEPADEAAEEPLEEVHQPEEFAVEQRADAEQEVVHAVERREAMLLHLEEPAGERLEAMLRQLEVPLEHEVVPVEPRHQIPVPSAVG